MTENSLQKPEEENMQTENPIDAKDKTDATKKGVCALINYDNKKCTVRCQAPQCN